STEYAEKSLPGWVPAGSSLRTGYCVLRTAYCLLLVRPRHFGLVAVDAGALLAENRQRQAVGLHPRLEAQIAGSQAAHRHAVDGVHARGQPRQRLEDHLATLDLELAAGGAAGALELHLLRDRAGHLQVRLGLGAGVRHPDLIG